jgi:hypothetical protein
MAWCSPYWSWIAASHRDKDGLLNLWTVQCGLTSNTLNVLPNSKRQATTDTQLHLRTNRRVHTEWVRELMHGMPRSSSFSRCPWYYDRGDLIITEKQLAMRKYPPSILSRAMLSRKPCLQLPVHFLSRLSRDSPRFPYSGFLPRVEKSLDPSIHQCQGEG